MACMGAGRWEERLMAAGAGDEGGRKKRQEAAGLDVAGWQPGQWLAARPVAGSTVQGSSSPPGRRWRSQRRHSCTWGTLRYNRGEGMVGSSTAAKGEHLHPAAVVCAVYRLAARPCPGSPSTIFTINSLPVAPESVPRTRTHLPHEPSNWALFMAP